MQLGDEGPAPRGIRVQCFQTPFSQNNPQSGTPPLTLYNLCRSTPADAARWFPDLAFV